MASPSLRISKDQAIDLNGVAIEVLVGAEPQVTFSVHEALVRKASDFFDKALNHEWKESQERSVSLPEKDPDTFQLYLHWLYFRFLPVRTVEGTHSNTEYLQLAKAYVLGDQLHDIDFNDAVIDVMLDKSRTPSSNGSRYYPGDSTIACIYNNTLVSSEARRLLIDLFVNFGHGKWLSKVTKSEDYPKEFLLELATALLDRRPYSSHGINDEEDSCKYHRHGATKVCYREGSGPGRVATTEKPN